jgi:hypothetical protein
MTKGSSRPAGPAGGRTEAQFLALWGGLPPPLLRLLDLYLLDNPDVPAPHVGMDVDRFQAGFIGWYRRSTDPEVRAALHEAVTYFAMERPPGWRNAACPQPGDGAS